MTDGKFSLTRKQEPMEWEVLPEDADERRSFERSVAIHGGDVRAAIANALRIFALVHPGGSFAAQCKIMANEVAKLDLALIAQPAPSAPEVTDTMALAFHCALTDGGVGVSEVEEIKVGLRAALAAAPETPRRGPLTDEQIDAIMPNPSDFGMCQPPWSGSDITILRAMARAVEAAHGITGDEA